MVFVRAGVCMWVCVCLQGSLRSWMMAERKLLGMRVCVCPCIAPPPPPCLLRLLLCIALHRTPFVPLCLLQVRK